MEIIQNYLTNNDCYKKGQIITIKGIMLHSTACPNVPAINFLKAWNTPQPNGKKVCVHAFVDPKEIYQTLPWNYQGWHAGGNANNELIGFEICEPKNYDDQEYFKNIKETSKKLCVFLCQKYDLKADTIITHCEAYKLKGKAYASNHADIDHWWKKYYNYTMDDFRKEVEIQLNKQIETKTVEQSLDYLVEKGKITNKEYWLKALETTRNLEYIFIKWAKDV